MLFRTNKNKFTGSNAKFQLSTIPRFCAPLCVRYKGTKPSLPGFGVYNVHRLGKGHFLKLKSRRRPKARYGNWWKDRADWSVPQATEMSPALKWAVDEKERQDVLNHFFQQRGRRLGTDPKQIRDVILELVTPARVHINSLSDRILTSVSPDDDGSVEAYWTFGQVAHRRGLKKSTVTQWVYRLRDTAEKLSPRQ